MTLHLRQGQSAHFLAPFYDREMRREQVRSLHLGLNSGFPNDLFANNYGRFSCVGGCHRSLTTLAVMMCKDDVQHAENVRAMADMHAHGTGLIIIRQGWSA